MLKLEFWDDEHTLYGIPVTIRNFIIARRRSLKFFSCLIRPVDTGSDLATDKPSGDLWLIGEKMKIVVGFSDLLPIIWTAAFLTV